MKNVLLFLLILNGICAPVCAQQTSNPPLTEGQSYSFLGFELHARVNKKYFPVEAADKKGVYVHNGKRLKRLPWTTPCMPLPTTFTTTQYAQVEQFDSEFIYARIPKGERNAFEKIQQSEQSFSSEIAQLRMQGRTEAAEALELELEGFQDDLDSDIRNSSFNKPGYADSVDVHLQITPSTSIKEAYVAIVVSYQREMPETGIAKKYVSVRVRRIGELLQDVPETLRFTAHTGEGDYSDSRVAVHLYSGNGTAIATNLSPRLKKLRPTDTEISN